LDGQQENTGFLDTS